MAQLVDTLLEKAIIRANDKFKQFENRMPEGGAIAAAMKYRDQVVPISVIEAAKVSKRRPVEIPVLKRYTPTIGTARAINPTPDVITSARVPLTWATKTFSFSVAPAINADNDIAMEEQFAAQLQNSLRGAFFDNANSVEKQVIAALAANAYATPPASAVGGVTVASGAYVVDNDENYILKAPVLMRELNLMGPYQDISNIASIARQRAMSTYGTANSRNFEQLLGDMEYYHSNNIGVTATYAETHYLTPAGSLALLNIAEFDARNGTAHSSGEYTIIRDPLYGFDWGVRIVTDVADLSATYGSGFERTVVKRYDFAADFAVVTAYSSTAGTSPIIKINTSIPA